MLPKPPHCLIPWYLHGFSATGYNMATPTIARMAMGGNIYSGYWLDASESLKNTSGRKPLQNTTENRHIFSLGLPANCN